MKNPFTKPATESGRLAVLVESLADKSTKLAARLADAERSAEAARAARTEKLADATETELDALILSVSQAEASISALASTHAEIERQLADARLKHGEALENERRAGEADTLETAAGLVDQRLAAVDKAANALKAAIADLHGAIPADLALWPNWDRQEGARRSYGPGTGSEAIGALVAECAFNAFPDGFTWSRWQATMALVDLHDMKGTPSLRHVREGRAPVAPVNAGQMLISQRLRALATELRQGGEARKVRAIAEPEAVASVPDVSILVHQAFRYRVLPSWHTASGDQFARVESHGVRTVPAPVASAAIAAGHAELAGTDEARAKAEAYAAGNASATNVWQTSPDEIIDLGDPVNVETTFQPSAPRMVA